MNGTRLPVLVLGVLCLVFVASPAGAEFLDVRMDMNDLVAPALGWNEIDDSGTTVHTLLDYASGLDSGAKLQITDAFNVSGNVVTSITWSNPAASWVNNNALLDYFFLNSTNPAATMVVSGLDPGTTYTIELLSVRDSSTSVDTDYQVNGAFGYVVDDSGNTTATTTENFNAYSDGFQNEQFMIWEDIFPDSSGEFTIDVFNGGTNVFFNGLRVSHIPEPSTLSLLAMGCLAMLGGLGVRSLRRTNRRR